jgi:putative ABC transport system permease protein
MLGREAVIVSEAFALRYKVEVGERVTLPTRQGPHPFTIAAIHYDYSNDRGTVVMDRPLFARYFDDRRPTGLTVYLEPGADLDAVRAALVSQFGTRHRMSIYTNRSLRNEVLRIFDATFAITWALELVAVAVAVMGIVATLVTLIMERRRELSLLRPPCSAASARQSASPRASCSRWS